MDIPNNNIFRGKAELKLTARVLTNLRSTPSELLVNVHAHVHVYAHVRVEERHKPNGKHAMRWKESKKGKKRKTAIKRQMNRQWQHGNDNQQHRKGPHRTGERTTGNGWRKQNERRGACRPQEEERPNVTSFQLAAIQEANVSFKLQSPSPSSSPSPTHNQTSKEAQYNELL